MNLLQRIRAAFLFSRFFPYVEDAEWDQADADALSHFLNSHAGKRLRIKLRNYATEAAMDAARKGDRYHSGTAAGIAMMNAAIDAHLPFETKSETEEADLTELETNSAFQHG